MCYNGYTATVHSFSFIHKYFICKKNNKKRKKNELFAAVKQGPRLRV